MNFTSLLHKPIEYLSAMWQKSQTVPGVQYAVRRTSLMQRIELTKKVRELTLQHEFLNAGQSRDQFEGTLSDLLVQRLYIEWGLADIRGLKIDGKPASAQLLIDRGPESLTNEIIAAVKAELHLTETETKNS